MPVPAPSIWNRLIRIITRVEDAVNGKVSAHLRNPSPSRREQIQDRSEVQRLLDQLDAEIPEEVFPVIRIAYEQGEQAALAVPKFDLFPVVNDYSQIKREAVNLLADNVTQRLGGATQTIGRRTDDLFRRHGLRAAASRALGGEDRPLGADTMFLKKQLEDQGVKAFEDKRGRLWNLTNYATMVVRTTTSEALQRGVINSMLSRSLDIVVVKHTDGGHPADECTPYEGKDFSLTGGTPGYKLLDRIPPFHPNCDHWLIPSPKAFEERAALEAA